jgi:hypothetical protein
MQRLQELVDAADVAGLLIAVDGLCAGREWDALADLARRCIAAGELGKQLWSVAMHIDYRLAWEGPPAHAGAVLRPGAGRFALGPLTEVAASTHDWSSLAPHLRDVATAASVAQERTIRGEDLRGDERAGRPELPLVIRTWEPAYALPVYRDRSAKFPQPEVAVRGLGAPRALQPGARLPDDPAVEALRRIPEAWVSQSAGRVEAVAVDGPAEAAVGTLSPVATMAPITPDEALALLQWAGASGGAYGRRPGGAAGRFSAWWAAAALAGLEWPADDDDLEPFADDLGSAVAELSWYRWNPASGETGWVLRLAVEDPVDGMAWAVDATDQREADDADAEASDAAAG